MIPLSAKSDSSDQGRAKGPLVSTIRQDLRKQTIAIAATFTAEPVEDVLAFWMQELGAPSAIAFAPYHQLFQQLLDPTSLLATNQRGVNVVLLRFEDWLRFETDGEHGKAAEEKIERSVRELSQTVQVAAGRSATPYLVCVCPASPAGETDAHRQAFFVRVEGQLAEDLAGLGGVHLIRSAEVTALYPVAQVYDPYGDKVGHVPYTPLFFAALGTLLARRIYALCSTPHKVIVVDCDQTLWQGVCAEDGALGVVVDEPRMYLQEFLVAQQAAGMLLCLCSKNNEQDVFDVFTRHPDMRLKREHLVAWRINWQPKSQNLRSLAEELQLSLESFIFIDDSPLECAEVQASCPEVLTFPLPQDLGRLPQLLQHFWAFDHLRVTAEDKNRTELYVQQVKRQALQKASSSLKDFLEGLELRVRIIPMGEAQLSRVAQLTQRTNQFNCTTIRRTESEIRQFCREGRGGECLVVEVGDRFGDYGLVGVILFTVGPGELEVDTFLLSCRVLGRGVEHRMLARLGEIARERGANRVLVPFLPTAKNTPALEFLEGNENGFEQADGTRRCFSFDAESLVGLVYAPLAEKAAAPLEELSEKAGDVVTARGVSTPQTEAKSLALLRKAMELSSAAQVLQAVSAQRRQHPGVRQPVAVPRTKVEEQLVEIWAEVLKLERVGIHDDFFALGGGSLQAAQIAARLYVDLHVEVPLHRFIEAPTVARFAEMVSQLQAQDTTPRAEEVKTDARAPLVVVQAGGSRRPFFFLHGQWTGSPLYTWELARVLGPEQPLYLLEPYKFAGLAVPPSFEAVAAAHLEALRGVQPTGPYRLGGWCNGGLMAYEVARQLHAQGQTVDLLVLIDPDAPSPAHRRLVRSAISRIGSLIGLGQDRQFDWFLRVQHLYRYLRISRYRRSKNSELLGTVERSDPIFGRSEFGFGLLDFKPKSFIPRVETLRREYLNMYEWVALDYTPGLYPGKITFFWTSEEPWRPVGWRQVIKAKEGEVEIQVIPGNHITSRTEYLSVLAERLRDCVNKTQSTSMN